MNRKETRFPLHNVNICLLIRKQRTFLKKKNKRTRRKFAMIFFYYDHFSVLN